MAKHEAVTTQSAHPWRATTRTLFAAIVALAALAPVIYQAITQSSPELATGAGAGVLFVAGAITRVMAIPGVDAFLQRFIPWLAAAERNDPQVVVNVSDVQKMTETDVKALAEDLQGRARRAKRSAEPQPPAPDASPSIADQVHYTAE